MRRRLWLPALPALALPARAATPAEVSIRQVGLRPPLTPSPSIRRGRAAYLQLRLFLNPVYPRLGWFEAGESTFSYPFSCCFLFLGFARLAAYRAVGRATPPSKAAVCRTKLAAHFLYTRSSAPKEYLR
jgi:hypothetical protein